MIAILRYFTLPSASEPLVYYSFVWLHMSTLYMIFQERVISPQTSTYVIGLGRQRFVIDAYIKNEE